MKNPSTISSGESDEPRIFWFPRTEQFSIRWDGDTPFVRGWQRLYTEAQAAALATKPAESKACASVGVEPFAYAIFGIVNGEVKLAAMKPWPKVGNPLTDHDGWGEMWAGNEPLYRAALASPAPAKGKTFTLDLIEMQTVARALEEMAKDAVGNGIGARPSTHYAWELARRIRHVHKHGAAPAAIKQTRPTLKDDEPPCSECGQRYCNGNCMGDGLMGGN